VTTLKQVRTAAAKFGATVEDTKIGNTHECRVAAPYGQVWRDGVHEFVDGANIPWKPDYADLLNRMSYGLEACTTPDCEWCEAATPMTPAEKAEAFRQMREVAEWYMDHARPSKREG
jgi:hypothetical protein